MPPPVPSPLVQLLRSASFEVLPRHCTQLKGLHSRLRPGTRVFLPHLRGADLQTSVNAARQVRRLGFTPVPHLCARRFASAPEWEAKVEALAAAGVEDVLLCGGAQDPPRGPFPASLDLLAMGTLQRHGIRRVGFAGHPEGNQVVPGMTGQRLLDSVWDKAEACAESALEGYLVTQFCFDPGAILRFSHRLTESDIPLPVYVGVAGACGWQECLRYAEACGVPVSFQLLSRNRGLLLYRPEQVLDPVARHMASNPESNIKGVHFYPFGALGATLRWVEAAIAADRAPFVPFWGA